MLSDVHLDASYLRRSPRQLSGGERQRIAIARALAASPAVLLCDETLSSLDVSVQARVRDLLHALQAEHGMTYLFTSHDLAVVRSLAHSVGVLFRGQLCDICRVDEVYEPPYHPYVSALLSAVPDLDCRAVADRQRPFRACLSLPAHSPSSAPGRSGRSARTIHRPGGG